MPENIGKLFLDSSRSDTQRTGGIACKPWRFVSVLSHAWEFRREFLLPSRLSGSRVVAASAAITLLCPMKVLNGSIFPSSLLRFNAVRADGCVKPRSPRQAMSPSMSRGFSSLFGWRSRKWCKPKSNILSTEDKSSKADDERAESLWKREDLAAYLNCALRTVDQLTADGILPVIKLSRRMVRYRPSEVKKALQQYTVNGLNG